MSKSTQLRTDLKGLVPHSAVEDETDATTESRRALAQELIGSLPAGRLTLEDYFAAKNEDTERER